MTVEFALQYIPARMAELGFGTNYLIRWRHLVVLGTTTIKIDADNEFYLLINPADDFFVRSKFGVFDLRDSMINEQLYEHRGKIFVKNRYVDPLLILFIQVIPIHKK